MGGCFQDALADPVDDGYGHGVTDGFVPVGVPGFFASLERVGFWALIFFQAFSRDIPDSRRDKAR